MTNTAFEERSIHEAYVSAKIEGNPYSRRAAAMLLQYGFTDGGKMYSDATMLVNLQKAFEQVALQTEGIERVLSSPFVHALHARIASGLLPESDCGRVRQRAMTIAGNSYRPLADAQALQAEGKKLLAAARLIANPFDLAVYTHCNIAYLQYFADGNKRLARLMQTAVLAAHRITPLFLREQSIGDYLDAIVQYYETGSFESYKALFVREYAHTIRLLTGQDDESP